MISAPVSDFAAVGLYEKIRYQVFKAPADGGKLSLREFPEKLREMFEEIFLIDFLIDFRESRCPGKENIGLFCGKIQRLFWGKLGFIRKNGGHCAAKGGTDASVVGLVGQLDKFINGLRI